MVKVNFVIFCRSIEHLYQHIFAKLYFATANNEKATVNYMQLPEDYWTFSVELTKSHLFRQKLMPALQNNDVTKTQNSFWIKSRTGEDMEQFSAGPVNTRSSADADKPAWHV